MAALRALAARFFAQQACCSGGASGDARAGAHAAAPADADAEVVEYVAQVLEDGECDVDALVRSALRARHGLPRGARTREALARVLRVRVR
jgi:hypothetical protein